MNNFEITEIEEIIDCGYETNYVYDIEMECDSHVFFGNDILLHNSVFFSSIPIIKKKQPDIDLTDDKTIIKKTVELSIEVADYINELLKVYSTRIRNSKNNQFIFKQENVSRSGFWVAKKRYAQWIVNIEGVDIGDETMDVKGLDVVRSSYPNSAKKVMTEILWDILKDKPKKTVDTKLLNYKTDLKDKELLNKMFSVGVKSLEKYDSNERDLFSYPKGITAQSRAILGYNDLLTYFKLDNEPITNGGKIKWCYLKDSNPLKLNSLALTGYKDPIEITNYILEHIDNDKMFETTLEKKMIDFYDSMNWGDLPKKENKVAAKFFNF